MTETLPMKPPKRLFATEYTERMVLSMALLQDGIGWTYDDFCEEFGLTSGQLRRLAVNKKFQSEVAETLAFVREHGLTFRTKSRALAHELLDDIYVIAKDPATSPSVRTEIFAKLVKYGELEPKGGVTLDDSDRVSITINLNNGKDVKTITSDVHPLKPVEDICDI